MFFLKSFLLRVKFNCCNFYFSITVILGQYGLYFQEQWIINRLYISRWNIYFYIFFVKNDVFIFYLFTIDSKVYTQIVIKFS